MKILNLLIHSSLIKSIILFVLFVVPILHSCNSDYVDFSCSPKLPYGIEIIDKDSLNILGFDKQYNPDSIYYEIDNKVIKAYTTLDHISINFIGLDKMNDKDFYLHLNSSDTDTLKMMVENKTNECGDNITTIIEFYYNKKQIIEKKRIFKIIK